MWSLWLWLSFYFYTYTIRIHPYMYFPGATIDGACRLWSAKCKNSGFCKYYDNEAYTLRFYGLLAALKIGSFIAYGVVLYLVHRRDAGKEEEEEKEGERKVAV